MKQMNTAADTENKFRDSVKARRTMVNRELAIDFQIFNNCALGRENEEDRHLA